MTDFSRDVEDEIRRQVEPDKARLIQAALSRVLGDEAGLVDDRVVTNARIRATSEVDPQTDKSTGAVVCTLYIPDYVLQQCYPGHEKDLHEAIEAIRAGRIPLEQLVWHNHNGCYCCLRTELPDLVRRLLSPLESLMANNLAPYAAEKATRLIQDLEDGLRKLL